MNAVAGHLRLLLVAADSESIRGLARDLFVLDEHLETAHRTDASGALALLEAETFDVVAVDLRLPIDVLGLLSTVAARFPRLIRMLVADDPGDVAFSQAAHLAHCLLPRPCDAGTLLEAVQDTVTTSRRMRDPVLSTAVAGILALPESPAMRRELLGLLADDDISVSQLEEAVERNPAIAAKILQIANSAYFGARGSVTFIGEAISMLGLDTVRGIVTSAHLFNAMPSAGVKDLPVGELWNHCVATAVMTRRIAWHVRANANVNRAAFTAALLHDVGKVVMALAHGEAYAEFRRRPEEPLRQVWQEEERRFGHHHGTAGALLLQLWGLPVGVVEAVALHHTPHRTRENNLSPLTLVHIANALVHGDNPLQLIEARLDGGYLQRLLLPAKLDLWQSALTGEDQ
ncbi:MAG TPA: HDOD domain-containing protein [Opitutaceae bacterium]|nr:HDOD domain-containing protein [Opitutaceae bacterium]